MTTSDEGHTIQAVVTAGNAGGTSVSFSPVTATIPTPPPAAPSNSTAPAISGQAVQGQTLSTTNGSWTNSPTSYAYQWQDCDSSGANCASISGATSSSYTLVSGDVGHTLRVVVTATNGGGSTAASSAQTAVVVAPPPAPPSNTGLPQISGTAAVGQTLTTTNGSWTNSPTSYAYQWRRCDAAGANCSDIGSNTSSYTLVGGDSGGTIRVVVTATNAGGSVPATSAQTGVVSGGGGAGYAPVYVQSTATLNSGSSVTASTAAFASNVTQGNLIVVGVAYRGNPQAFTLTDTLGTVFHAAGSPATTDQTGGYTGRYTGQIEWGVAPFGGADTVSISFPSSTGHIQLHANEYNAANPQLDVTAQATGSGTTVTSGSVATNYANERLFGLIIVNNTVGVAGAGFTERGRTDGDIDEDGSVSALGSYAATATSPLGGTWSGQEATFYGTGPNVASPGQPTNVVATAGALSANLTWTAPASGGAPVSYVITPYIGATAQTPTTVSAPATGTTITGLTAGTAYTFTVTAANAAGQGSASAASNPVTPTSSGSAPVNTTGPYFTASTGTTTACSNGCAVVGQTLGVSTGTWTNSPTSYTYQWDRCSTALGANQGVGGNDGALLSAPVTSSCSAISGATSSTYTVQSADTGHSLVPIVTAYSGSTASSPTSLAGNCNRGEIVAPVRSQTLSPTSQIAGCSPISAVAGATQAAERLCTNAVTTCGYADPLNNTTGIPAGTTLSTTGACATYANGATISTNGTVVNGCRITGALNIHANNVTIENSDISEYNEGASVITQPSGYSGTQFLNDDIHGPSAATGDSLAWAIWASGGSGSLTLDHVYVYNIDRIFMDDRTSGMATINDSFCWSNGGGGEHHECIYNGGAGNETITNSVLLRMGNDETAAIFYDTPSGGGTGDQGSLDAENDIFGGGAFTLYPGAAAHSGTETFIGDRESRVTSSVGGTFGTVYSNIPAITTWSAMIWDDTGATWSHP